MWHPECFTCTNCDTILKPHKYVVEDDKPYCKDCHLRLFGPPCNVCKKPTQSVSIKNTKKNYEICFPSI